MEIVGTERPMGLVMDVIGTEINNAMQGRTQMVPTVIGDPGIGKSASLKYMAKQRNFAAYTISLGALPMEYFSGLPEFGEIQIDPKYIITYTKDQVSDSGEKVTAKTAEWTMSDLVRSINLAAESAIEDGKQGLIVLLDDVHLVEPIVQKYLFEFFQNKTLQNFKLHDKAFLVAAMNGKDSAGLEGFLSAVINRMAFYHAKFDKEYWYENIGFGLHPYIASFASGPNEQYFSGANATDGPSPSPRAWTDLSDAILGFEEDSNSLQMLNTKLQMAAESRVGLAAAVEFMKHVKLFQKFDFEDIFRKKDPNFQVSNHISDQILTAFIIRYIRTKEDADYLKEVIEKNLERRTFLSIFINEFVTLFRNINEIQDPKTKEAFVHLSELLSSEDAVDSELMDMVVEALSDIR